MQSVSAGIQYRRVTAMYISNRVSFPKRNTIALKSQAKLWMLPGAAAAISLPCHIFTGSGSTGVLFAYADNWCCLWAFIRTGRAGNFNCHSCSLLEDKTLFQRRIPIILTCQLLGFFEGKFMHYQLISDVIELDSESKRCCESSMWIVPVC